jgi:hypothetical protein
MVVNSVAVWPEGGRGLLPLVPGVVGVLAAPPAVFVPVGAEGMLGMRGTGSDSSSVRSSSGRRTIRR